MKKCFTCKMDPYKSEGQGHILSDTFLQMKQSDLHVLISDVVFCKHSVKCMSVR